MRNKILVVLMLLFSFSVSLKAVPAKPDPITVTQPDGTTITIVVHGDEFLNWITCGNSLVAQGEDGWWYYATFDADGNSIPGSQKVTGSSARQAPSFGQSSVIPPASAFNKADAMRKERMSHRKQSISYPSNAKNSSATLKEEPMSIGKNKRFLVILAEFSDLKFTINGGGENARLAFEHQMNEEGYNANGAIGSVRDYFVENSHSKFEPIFDVYGPFTATKPMSQYENGTKGETSRGVPQLLVDACKALNDQIDFSKYDNDNDGNVDNVFIYFAGHNSAEGASGTIWPHQWYAQQDVQLDGVWLDAYACTSEYRGKDGKNMAGISTCCHEFGHSIGLPDFYNTKDSSTGRDVGVYSVMSYGTYNANGTRPPYYSAEERYLLGWLDDMPVPSGPRTLKPIQDNAVLYVPTLTKDEYYWYEFRNGKRWDEGLKTGVLIYHVDKSTNRVDTGKTASNTWDDNTINDYSDHPCMDLLKASSSSIPFGNGNNAFTEFTSPAALDWAGRSIGCNLKNIEYTSESASLEFEKGSLSGYVYDVKGSPIKGAVITVYCNASNNAPISFESPQFAPVSTNVVTTVTTDSKGFYKVESDVISGKTITVAVHKDGYKEDFQNFLFINSKYIVFRLMTADSMTSGSLQKFSGDFKDYISGAQMVATKFSSSDLKNYVGKIISSISVGVQKDGDEKITLFVQQDNNSLLSKDITDIIESSGMTFVDISDQNLKIPSLNNNSNLYIGVKSTSSNTKFAFDNSTYVSGGMVYKAKTSSWYWSEESKYGNFMISAYIGANDKETIALSGIKYINSGKENYKAGDKFTLSVDNSDASPYTSVEWEVNSETKQDGSTITLQAGITDIKATLFYPTGKMEVILMKIVIE